tara:strand:- start:76 stop:336 length:261 start_codon:yes stop_codon:yes gene_type:complete
MKVVSRDLDKIIEVWSIQLDELDDIHYNSRGKVAVTNESWYEVHVEINHNPADGERRITDIFPEYGEVTDAIRKKLEEVVQKMEVI